MASQRNALLTVDEAAVLAGEVDIIRLKAQSNLYRVLLHQPQIAKRVNDLIDTLMTETDLDTRLRELIIMRIGWVNGGVYEWTQHWRIAQDLGVDEYDLIAVRNWEAHDHWSAVDRAALRATDETLGRGFVSRATWEVCADAFQSERQRVELVTTIGAWKMMSEILRSLDVPLEHGIVPWPPDGISPHENGTHP